MYGNQNTELLTGHLLLVTCIIRTCIISITLTLYQWLSCAFLISVLSIIILPIAISSSY